MAQAARSGLALRDLDSGGERTDDDRDNETPEADMIKQECRYRAAERKRQK